MRFFLFLICTWVSLTAQAHEIRPALLQLTELDPGKYEVIWKVPARDDQVLGLQVNFDGEPLPQADEVLVFDGSLIKKWTLTLPDNLTDTDVSVDGLELTYVDVIVRVVDQQDGVVTHRLSPDNPGYTFGQPPSFSQVAKTYTKFGIEHILIGIDHLLFVACLVLITGFTRQLFWAITGFTLAHSITLALSALGLVNLSVPPVEAIIALSIVFLSAEIVKNHPQSLSHRYPVVVSSSFGLLHGFGFAAVLNQIGLPKNEFISSLLFFNLGVEIGQLLFVAGLLLVLYLLHLLPFITRRPMEVLASYVIGSVAMMWLIERVIAFKA